MSYQHIFKSGLILKFGNILAGQNSYFQLYNFCRGEMHFSGKWNIYLLFIFKINGINVCDWFGGLNSLMCIIVVLMERKWNEVSCKRTGRKARWWRNFCWNRSFQVSRRWRCLTWKDIWGVLHLKKTNCILQAGFLCRADLVVCWQFSRNAAKLGF